MEFPLPETIRLMRIDLSVHANQNIPFPWKLHEMLDTCEKEGLSHIVSWLPDNNSFRVHNPVVFMSDIIGNFFKQTKYKSFQRQLNIWGFQRIICGPNKGGYSHKYFVRSRESLCCMMSRQKIKSEKPAKPRPYFPIRVSPPSIIRNRNAFTDQGPNNLLQHDLKSNKLCVPSKSIENLSDDMETRNGQRSKDGSSKGMIPLNTFTTGGPSNPATSETTYQVHFDPCSTPDIFPCVAEISSPKAVHSFPTPRRTRSCPERCLTPDLVVNEINDEKIFSNSLQDIGEMMDLINPDPIAPDHPLSKRFKVSKKTCTSNINRIVSNMIDDSGNNNTPVDQMSQQNDSWSFAGRNMFTVGGECMDRRSSLGV